MKVKALLQEAHEAGTRIIMTTHNLGQLRRLARDVVFLHEGRVVETGPCPEVLNAPASAELTAFLNGDIL